MSDIAVVYTLTGPGGTIIFNNGALKTLTDLYYITNITGLDGPPLRTPISNRPVTDGGIVHTFYKGPRHIVIEGIILVQSVLTGNAIQAQRNIMEEDLMDCLDGIYQADGTLSWTPSGLSAKSLTVRQEVPVAYTYDNDFFVKTFSFGLVSEEPDF